MVYETFLNSIRQTAINNVDIDETVLYFRSETGYFESDYLSGFYDSTNDNFIFLEVPDDMILHLNSLSLTDQEKIDLLIATNEVVPLAFDFLNQRNFLLPRSITMNQLQNLFEMGFRPTPHRFSELVGHRIAEFGALYFQYIGLPHVTEEEAEALEDKGLFITYVHRSLGDIIVDIIQTLFTFKEVKGKKVTTTEGDILGLEIKHGLTNMRVRDHTISFERMHLFAASASVKFIATSTKLNKITIRLIEFNEPLSELVTIQKYITNQQYHNFVFQRIFYHDFSMDLLDLKDYNINQTILFSSLHGTITGSPLECAGFLGDNDIINRLVNANANPRSLKDGSFAQYLLDGTYNNKIDLDYHVKEEDMYRYNLRNKTLS